MHDKFLKPYDFKGTESEIYTRWEEAGYFNPDKLPGDRKDPFTIVLPPPNVTGTLHMGHAAMLAVEDILVRTARMQGKRALWIPGTDSAAIATQSKVEGEIYKKEKKTRYDIGREELLKRIDAFTKESESTIISQVKRMGSSLDWSRYAYTLDGKRYSAVMTAFVRMYDAGLIYRGDRIVNWDPKLQTTVSDDEIEYVEESVPFYYFKYGPFTIGTVRPETKFGDKYVVMHPDDARYKEWKHGQKIDVEWINGPITATVIKDEAADMEVGSGVMTITPAHSVIDFEIAKRHNLDIERVIDDRGILLDIAGEFKGQHIKKARPMIVEKLQAKGLIEKVDEKYVHNIATNSRGGGIIEPQIKLQWFIAVNKEFTIPYSEIPSIASGSTTTLKALMRAAVESHATTILPERFERVYMHWIENLRDWCISRQIWFGHRIPAWYRSTDAHGRQNGTPSDSRGVEEIKVQIESPGEGWEQDADTLDTWFSSGLWTFSTLGWPEKTEDMKRFHPTSVLETGYDIIFFWVARMVLMSAFHLGQVPFKTVYLHGLVRDAKGKKMSKSLGNIIDPVDMIEKYGADAARLSLIIGAAPGNDIKLSEDRVRGYKNFANKIWNIARFVLENTEGIDVLTKPTLNAEDTADIEELNKTITEVTKQMNDYRLDLAADATYHYIWHTFADVVIEKSKTALKGEDAEAKQRVAWKLYTILTTSLKLIHPFMPFVTEEIWSHLPEKDADMLIVAPFPTVHG